MAGARLVSMGGSWYGDKKRARARVAAGEAGDSLGSDASSGAGASLTSEVHRAADRLVRDDDAPPARDSESRGAAADGGDVHDDEADLQSYDEHEEDGDEALREERGDAGGTERDDEWGTGVRGGRENAGGDAYPGRGRDEFLFAWDLEARARSDPRYARVLAQAWEEVLRMRREREGRG
jgi:hypothetical protein